MVRVLGRQCCLVCFIGVFQDKGLISVDGLWFDVFQGKVSALF